MAIKTSWWLHCMTMHYHGDTKLSQFKLKPIQHEWTAEAWDSAHGSKAVWEYADPTLMPSIIILCRQVTPDCHHASEARLVFSTVLPLIVIPLPGDPIQTVGGFIFWYSAEGIKDYRGAPYPLPVCLHRQQPRRSKLYIRQAGRRHSLYLCNNLNNITQ